MNRSYLLSVVTCALLCACSAAGESDAPTGEEVGAKASALGEDACTTVPAPALGTTNNNIGYYQITEGNCMGAWDFASPSYTYNPSGCPRQYIVQLYDDNARPFGESGVYRVEPVWVAGGLTSTTCAQSHLAITAWRQFSYLSTYWELPPIAQMTATGHWENGNCVFRRDDNNGYDLGIGVTIPSQYERTARVAVQAKTNSNYHSVGIHVYNGCI